MKSKVAVLKVKPQTILADIERLCGLAGMEQALAKGATTILKDNISWHYPFPGANTTPWQMEGSILALRNAGYQDIVCVQNKTVVTNAFKGEDLNHYLPLFAQYDIPVLYNFKPEDMKWIVHKPKAKMHVLDHIFPEGITIPDYFQGKNIVHLPTVKCVAGDTELILGDGSRTTIRELVTRQAKGGRTLRAADGTTHATGRAPLLAMGRDGRLGVHEAVVFSKSARAGRRVLRLRTRSGQTLTATTDHRIHTPDGWKPLGDLHRDSAVALAAGARAFGGLEQRQREVVAVEGELGLERAATEPMTRLAIRGSAAAIAHMGITWDPIESIEPVEGVEDLYDITVPGADSFVANGIVVHNCHIYTTTTGAMKNAFGGLLNTKRHYTHTWIHRTLVDLLAIQKEIHSGLFAIMDGTTAGNGPGPRTMFPVIKDYMLASADQVAIDAVAAKMMGFDPMKLEFISVAHQDGLGIGDPRDIEIVGDDVSGESWGFQVGDNGASMIGDLLWFGPLKRIQKVFFHTPLVNAFILGSEVYHDYYRWPLRDRKTFDDWRATTHWGRLFDEYGRRRSGAPGSNQVDHRV